VCGVELTTGRAASSSGNVWVQAIGDHISVTNSKLIVRLPGLHAMTVPALELATTSLLRHSRRLSQPATISGSMTEERCTRRSRERPSHELVTELLTDFAGFIVTVSTSRDFRGSKPVALSSTQK
jgi:hypothetical protein